jgi:hypothetical protein
MAEYCFSHVIHTLQFVTVVLDLLLLPYRALELIDSGMIYPFRCTSFDP